MAFPPNEFQPGKILNEVIVGCLRAAGTNMHRWCLENDVNLQAATNATFGRSGGPRGKELLDRMIDAAGREAVIESYRRRVLAEAAKLQQVA